MSCRILVAKDSFWDIQNQEMIIYRMVREFKKYQDVMYHQAASYYKL
jgi:hypothetical protein